MKATSDKERPAACTDGRQKTKHAWIVLLSP